MDQEAAARFAAFASAHGRRLRRLAYFLVWDWHQAEDLTQVALARIYLAWPRVERAAKPEAYACRVLINAGRTGQRRRRIVEQLTEHVPDQTLADPAEGQVNRSALRAALQRLPRGQRAMVVLRYMEDLSETATAEALGVSVGTVKSQTAKALAALRADAVLHEEVSG